MLADELKAKILVLLTDVAPDVDPTSVQVEVDFREQFDFDSMDQLNFAIALHEAFKIEIPESDYPKLASLAKCIAYIKAKL
ncbi:MAG TPA: phosphopantetheine-binding protein [Steroidobacteraceae bacterium]|nr:phosphopantetheine-binding protein [Steroidobacteraceae bacterium]